jgi:putative oxidoreductase
MDSTTARRTAPLGALVLRLSLGAMYVAHALLKLLVFTLPGTGRFFASVGLPAALAYPVFVAEMFGGLLLIAGWRTRQVSLALAPILIGALWVHAGNGWVFTSPNGGWEYPAFLLAVTVALAAIAEPVPSKRTTERTGAVRAIA